MAAQHRVGRARDRLTDQQRRVIGLAADGDSDKTIAHRLNISERTVRFHFANIRQILGAFSRTQAVALAVSRNLVLPAAGRRPTRDHRVRTRKKQWAR